MKKFFSRIKRGVPIVFCLLVICSCFAFAASATVNIDASQSVAQSATISVKKVKYSGRNNAASKHSLYFITQYLDTKGNWRDSDELLIEPNTGFTQMTDNENYFSTNYTWRLELNPYGIATKGCSGYGTIWDAYD